MRINLFGQRNILGGGVYYAGFSDALKRFTAIALEIREYDVLNPGDMERAQDETQPEDVNIWFILEPTMGSVLGRNVALPMFETNKLPGFYVNLLNHYADLVWAPSRWARDVLEANGVDGAQIDLVPGGVDASAFHPYCRPSASSAEGKTRFLIVGKFEERKGYKQLFQAFSQAFNAQDDVELHIKGDYFLAPDGKIPALRQLADALGSDKVVIHQGMFSRLDLFKLYNSADVFVFPSRAEGWGLPLIEAIASGMPVVATCYSGQSEYLDRMQGLFLPVKYALATIADVEMNHFWPTDDGVPGSWAEPDTDDLAAQMRAAHEDLAAWKTNALQASEVIRREFDWQRTASAALSSLRERGLLETIGPGESP